MQASEFDNICSDCLRGFVDAGDEMVCPSCGVVKEKDVVEPEICGPGRVRGFGSETLGSYMGPKGATDGEKFAQRLTASGSKFGYLKVVSDNAGRDEGLVELCAKTLGRVAERLFLPRAVVAEATSIAQKVVSTRNPHRRVTVAAVSAYSLIAACKVLGIASVSAREIRAAHVDLGRNVSTSSIIQLMLESPIKTCARKPEDYLSRVLARLSTREPLVEALAREGVPQTAFFNSLRETAKDALECVDEDGRAGRRPSALAASAVYSAETILALSESRKKRMTQRLVAECGDAAEYTIREQCAKIFAPIVSLLVRRRLQTLHHSSGQ